MCRSVFEITATENKQRKGTTTSTSASSLPVNLFASSILAATTTSSSTSSTADYSAAKKVNPNEIKCEICEDGGEDAASFCVQCSQYFCEGCQRAHKRQKGTAFHEVVSVEKALKGKMKASVVYCEKHPQYEINTYCHTDKLAVCSECSVDFHANHQVERLANVVQEFKEEISFLAEQVSFFSFFLLYFLSFFLSFFFFFF